MVGKGFTTRVPHTWWNDIATSSTSDIGTSEVSEIELETSGSAYDASVDTGDDTEAGSSVVSLLSVLRQPTPLQLARKHKVNRTQFLQRVQSAAKAAQLVTIRMSSQLIVSNSMLMIIFKCLLESYSAQLVGKKLP